MSRSDTKERVEFAKEQLQRVFTTYPSYRDYLLKKSDRDGKERAEATYEAWARMIAKADPRDLAAVVDDVCSGELDIVGDQYQSRDQLPLILLKSARTRLSHRRNVEHAEKLRVRERPSYACSQCCDTGSVPCLDPKLIAKAMEYGVDVLPDNPHLVCYACGECWRGGGLSQGATSGSYRYRPVAEYDPAYCFAVLSWMPDRDPQRLSDWIADYRIRKANAEVS